MKKYWSYKAIAIIAAMILVGGLAAFAEPMSNGGEKVPTNSINAGGGKVEAGNFSSYNSIGQNSAIGVASNAGKVIKLGHQYTIIYGGTVRTNAVHNVTKNTYYGTIAAALYDVTSDGNLIIIETDGLYSENIDFWPSFQDTVLVSEARNPINVKVSGSYNGIVFDLSSLPANIRGTIEGLTIADGNGGGIKLSDNSAMIIRNCLINNNRAPEGGGIRNGTAISCTISGNTADSGSGGGSYNTALIGCSVRNNKALLDGGGLFMGSAKSCSFIKNGAAFGGGASNASLIDSCTFFQNTNTTGGNGSAVYFDRSADSTIVNTIISGNTGNAIYNDMQNNKLYITNSTIYASNILNYQGQTIIKNSIINNATITLNNGFIIEYNSNFAEADPTKNGNIGGSPAFINASSDPAAANFRLQSLSPCRDTGDPAGAPTVDLDSRVRSGNPDMGAYEFETPLFIISPTGGETFNIADVVNISWASVEGAGIKGNSLRIRASYDRQTDHRDIPLDRTRRHRLIQHLPYFGGCHHDQQYPVIKCDQSFLDNRLRGICRLRQRFRH
jgi:hypothetical protein